MKLYRMVFMVLIWQYGCARKVPETLWAQKPLPSILGSQPSWMLLNSNVSNVPWVAVNGGRRSIACFNNELVLRDPWRPNATATDVPFSNATVSIIADISSCLSLASNNAQTAIFAGRLNHHDRPWMHVIRLAQNRSARIYSYDAGWDSSSHGSIAAASNVFLSVTSSNGNPFRVMVWKDTSTSTLSVWETYIDVTSGLGDPTIAATSNNFAFAWPSSSRLYVIRDLSQAACKLDTVDLSNNDGWQLQTWSPILGAERTCGISMTSDAIWVVVNNTKAVGLIRFKLESLQNTWKTVLILPGTTQDMHDLDAISDEQVLLLGQTALGILNASGSTPTLQQWNTTSETMPFVLATNGSIYRIAVQLHGRVYVTHVAARPLTAHGVVAPAGGCEFPLRAKPGQLWPWTTTTTTVATVPTTTTKRTATTTASNTTAAAATTILTTTTTMTTTSGNLDLSTTPNDAYSSTYTSISPSTSADASRSLIISSHSSVEPSWHPRTTPSASHLAGDKAEMHIGILAVGTILAVALLAGAVVVLRTKRLQLVLKKASNADEDEEDDVEVSVAVLLITHGDRSLCLCTFCSCSSSLRIHDGVILRLN
eukprot:TRINITY_DN11248_c1_g1_i2.p1 TRINITY_DN11248_c1_g1~~TRINITY_DN11248_c1_g1_i2.p1  ORF type:complete len:596 (+),score=82.67 TRINITY_DN11248_c1_g1_i2:1386-3173(+)